MDFCQPSYSLPLLVSGLVLRCSLICNKTSSAVSSLPLKPQKKTHIKNHLLCWGVKRTVWRVSWLQSQQSTFFHVGIDVPSIRYQDSSSAALLFLTVLVCLGQVCLPTHLCCFTTQINLSVDHSGYKKVLFLSIWMKCIISI